MIVTCEECNSRFNLDENLIMESGSKVKCSKCHHIFTVHKLVPVEEPESALELEEASADLPDSAEATLPSLEAEEAPEETAMLSEEALDLDLSEVEEKPAEEEIALEEAGLEEEPAPEEPNLSEVEEKPAEEEIALEEAGLEEEPAPEEPKAVEEQLVIEDAEAKTEFEELADAVSVESLEGAAEEETEQVEPVEEELMPPPLVAEEVPRARRRLGTPLMIVLALVLLAGGAFAAYGLLKSLDIKIPLLESLTGGPESGIIDPGNLRIALLDELIKSEFVDSNTAGRLFVVKGKVRNDYSEARNFIMVKGALYSKDGKTADNKTIYCGNTLSGTDLQALDKATMDRKLRKRSSFSVPSGKVIPFLVVFSDLPQDLGEFSVEVVSSAPG
jgi:predicted Zn finger-like uncharacterized protein